LSDATPSATTAGGFSPLLRQTLAGIAGPDPTAVAEARARQDQLTKPRGALGVLEDLSVQLAGLAGQCPPPLPQSAAVAVFAGDHGVHAQGVSPWPQEVTTQMVANIVAGGAAVNVLATQVGAQVLVVDVGVAGELPELPGLARRRVRAGTADFTTGPAMTRAEALAAIETGIAVARELAAAGHTLLATGDMGIANTTPSAALVAAFTGADPADVTGRGTGIDDATWTLKVDVVRRGLSRHADAIRDGDPVDVLAAVGGLEHAAIAGFVLGAAALRLPVLLDGVIAGSAALVAAALAPEAVGAWIAGHRSVEPGAAAALRTLGLRPVLELELRLGEGTGALLAVPVVQAAARVLRDMATFDSAGVVGKDAVD
jgi:nicotinate-nucleotide--dimethylbenzimidazole phosphoribosyltransferase